MRFSFRAKMLGIVGITAFMFLLLIVINVLITANVKQQISQIQKNYIPIIELGPRLESEFEATRRGFLDAVAARDFDTLEKTKELKNIFLAELDTGRGTIDTAKAMALQNAFEDYYSTAYDMSRRLMLGETGVTLVDVMHNMQTKQAQTVNLMKEATVLDKATLAQAFAAISKALDRAANFRFWIDILCPALVLLFSLLLSRGVIRNLNELKSGFARFGEKNFSQPIQVVTNDEFGDVARQANQMSTLISDLLKERESQATALKVINKELESFSYSVAHDLRAPLRSMLGFSSALVEDYAEALPKEAKDMLDRVSAAANKMGQLVDGLLDLSRLSRTEMKKDSMDLSKIVTNIVTDLQRTDPSRKTEFKIQEHVKASGDPKLLEIVLTNLLGNAWKFTSKKDVTQLEFGQIEKDGHPTYFIKDNGVGFDMLYKDKLFGTFQRLHSVNEFEGTGIGLATVQRIIHRHNGMVWADAELNKGATFYFYLN